MAEISFPNYMYNILPYSKIQVEAVIEMLAAGNTIPFIARYRKEKTQGLDEVAIEHIGLVHKKTLELEDRKKVIIAAIDEQNKLSDALLHSIMSCTDIHTLEDIYTPYKRKRKTKADMAREAGLGPFAAQIKLQKTINVPQTAEAFLSDYITSIEQAIKGAQDIIAEEISEDQQIKEKLRDISRRSGFIVSRVVAKKKEEASAYKDYFDFKELLRTCPSHRFLAMLRGEAEGVLSIQLEIDITRAEELINRKYIRHFHHPTSEYIQESVSDSFKRLIFPSIVNQLKSESKEKADHDAIHIFSQNLRQLLLTAPLGSHPILAIDPAFRTGCKIVCLDNMGAYICHDTIYPHAPHNQKHQAENTLRDLLTKYAIRHISLGNGTASRETETWLRQCFSNDPYEVHVVNESGASIYSASALAREEFPTLDVTVRGAISIGRRLIDPLAELVKIDPKSIGVGQYQHDVHQKWLKESLDNTVMSCVNHVGINLNTASEYILTYVSGLGPVTAKNIVEYRTENGPFSNINQLKKVSRLGDKAFEQCAGFLRIKNGEEVLDDTGVHPESYVLVRTMASAMHCTVADLINKKELRESVKPSNFIHGEIGVVTITDIISDLGKKGLDPRGVLEVFSFDSSVQTIEDIVEGMILPGKVTNLTQFGAFVDIGVKQDGLVHISEVCNDFIKSPMDVLSLQQKILVKVIGLDLPRKRINLSIKQV